MTGAGPAASPDHGGAGRDPAPDGPELRGGPGEAAGGDRTRGGTGTLAVRLLQLALTVLVTWFVARRIGLGVEDLAGVDLARWRPALLPFAASCLLLLGGYALSAAIWGRMVRDLGGPRVPLGASIRIFLVANLGRYVPGKLWQVAGLAFLARRRGVPATVATGAAVLGQGVALAGASLVGATAFLGGGPEVRRWGVWIFAGLAGVLGVGLLPPVFRRLLRLWFRAARRDPPPGMDPGPGVALRWLVLYTGNWVVYAISFWLLAESFGLDVTVTEAAPAFAAAYVLGYVVLFAPAGIGVREVFLAGLLAPAVGQGSAATLAVVARLWSTAVEVLPAAFLWAREAARTPPAPAPRTGSGVREVGVDRSDEERE